MSHLSQEDLDAVKAGYLEHKAIFNDALDVTDKLIPDSLIAPRSTSGVLNRLDPCMTAREFRKLAKAILDVAEAREWLDKREQEMKAAGLSDQL
jgi:hypothetical protein